MIIAIVLIILIPIAIIAYKYHQLNNDKSSTYALTAKLITLYYLAVKANPKSKKISLEEILSIVCILDTTVYINSGTITPFDIDTAVDLAIAASNNTHDMLTNLIGSMEILIFAADTNLSIDAVTDAVIAKKTLISVVVTETLAMGKEYPLYPSIKQRVDEFFSTYECN